MPRALRFFRFSESRPVVIAGSTMRGEEVTVLRAFARVRAGAPRALLVIAPRHPERFDEVERLARDEGFRTVRRSALTIDEEPAADVVVLDTIGELAELYRLATIVFVGGSLVPTGGHNILEPAVFGRPILFGPHMENFQEIAAAFLEAGAAVQVGDEWELEAALRDLLADPARREALGRAAQAIVETNHGARERTLAAIAELLPPGGTRPARPFRVVRRSGREHRGSGLGTQACRVARLVRRAASRRRRRRRLKVRQDRMARLDGQSAHVPGKFHLRRRRA